MSGKVSKIVKPMELESSSLPPPQRVGFLIPVASDEELVDGFKRYVSLKDKLLEESDYVWYAVFKVGEKVDRKGFNTRAEAENLVGTIRTRGATGDLEKRVRKSGCLKLGKAFGISTTILEERLDREKGFAEYRMRAEAANGQIKEKTGSCDRSEKGKAQVPFDTIMGTACTRAEDRAIMALLGGETTAEEMSEDEVANQMRPAPVVPPADRVTFSKAFQDAIDRGPAPVPTPTSAPSKTLPSPLPSLAPTVKTPEQVAADIKRAVEAAGKPPGPLPPDVQKTVNELNEKFAGTAPAKPVDKHTLIGRMFQAAKAAKIEVESLKNGIRSKYKVESTKELTEAQLIEATRILEEIAADKDRNF